MRKLSGISLPILCLFLFSLTDAVFTTSLIQDACAQQSGDGYRLRQDDFDARKEGIKEHKTKPVTSDKIVLLSALIITAVPDEVPVPDVIRLGFYTEQKTTASVEIFCDRKLYYVDPLRKDWGPGIATFRWPTEIMRRYEIPINDLYARATHIERAERRLFPACLYSGDLPTAVREYRFVVAPLRAMQVQYWIIDAETDSLVVTGTELAIGANEQRLITWNGLDGSGNEISEGECLLKLRGVYKPRFGRQRTVYVNYNFYHKPKLNQ